MRNTAHALNLLAAPRTLADPSALLDNNSRNAGIDIAQPFPKTAPAPDLAEGFDCYRCKHFYFTYDLHEHRYGDATA